MNHLPDQPKPGVWTADVDGVLLPMHRFVGQYAKEIADAHNAALATEKGSRWSDTIRELNDVQEQLAAEQEKFRKAKEWNQVAELELRNVRSLHNEMMSDMARLSNELAAEREKFDTLQRQSEELHGRAQRAEQQLAAERELRKKLSLSWTLSKSDNQELRKQLAAERGNDVISRADYNAALESVKQDFAKQLAAEREKAKVGTYPLPDGRTK